MQNLVKDLKKSILDKESKQALSLFLKGLSQNEIHLLREIKAQGVFRCSTYAFEVKILQFLINSVISTQSLSQESISYLESIKSLLFIGRELKKILKILNQEIEKSTFKSYLVSLDALFCPHYFNKKTQFCNMGYSKEEIASAFSFFFFKLNEKKVSISINYIRLILEVYAIIFL